AGTRIKAAVSSAAGQPTVEPVSDRASRDPGCARDLAAIEPLSGQALNEADFLRAAHGVVRRVGLEPTSSFEQRVLSAPPLPFGHRRLPLNSRCAPGRRPELVQSCYTTISGGGPGRRP